MKKFLVLYRSTVSAQQHMSSATPEQAKAGMDAWMAGAKKSATSLVDMGAAVGDTALLKGTKSSGFVGGYSIVQADSLDQAKGLFDVHPHFAAPGASIEILELLPM